MKKLFILSLVALIIIIYPRLIFARTVGNYIGADIVRTSYNFALNHHIDNAIFQSIYTNPTSSSSYGFRYNYAINYKGFFIAPGVFYEKNNNKNDFNKSSQPGLNLDSYYGHTYSKILNRYGPKLDVGYDVTENFALFGSIGYVNNSYQNQTSIYYDGYYRYLPTYNSVFKDMTKLNKNPWAITNGRKLAPFFGGGFRIKLFKYWSFSGEYSYTKFKSKSNAQQQSDFTGTTLEYHDKNIPRLTSWPQKISLNNEIRIIKFGINYNF